MRDYLVMLALVGPLCLGAWMFLPAVVCIMPPSCAADQIFVWIEAALVLFAAQTVIWITARRLGVQ